MRTPVVFTRVVVLLDVENVGPGPQCTLPYATNSFYVREGDENNTVMRFAPQIAPVSIGICTATTHNEKSTFANVLYLQVKCSVFPLTHNSDAMDSVVHSVRDKLVARAISNKVHRAHGTQTGRSLLIVCLLA